MLFLITQILQLVTSLVPGLSLLQLLSIVPDLLQLSSSQLSSLLSQLQALLAAHQILTLGQLLQLIQGLMAS